VIGVRLYRDFPSTVYNHGKLHRITVLVFLARDSIYAERAIYNKAYAIACPSVRPSHGWNNQKQLKLGSCNFNHRV